MAKITNTGDKKVSAYVSFDRFDEINYLRLRSADFESVAERTMTRRSIWPNKLPRYAGFYTLAELNK